LGRIEFARVESNRPRVLADNSTKLRVGSISVDVKGLGEIRVFEKDLSGYGVANALEGLLLFRPPLPFSFVAG
jgi:hypothetical protein